jgi:hypothetical protein
VVVPAFYLIMDDISRGLSWVFGRFIGASEDEVEAPEASELAMRINRVGNENAALRERLEALEGKLPRAKLPPAQHAAE